MSTSVYSSSRLLLSSRNQDLGMICRPEIKRVKRILFGPVDPQATKKFIDDEMKNIIVTKSEQWNFDFKKGTTLDPNGLFDWRLATPKKQMSPLKRKADTEQDNIDQYCDISEIDNARPRQNSSCPSPNGHKTQQQSRITDFLKATKRSSSDVSKKQSSEWTSDIPVKIPRLDIAS